MPRKITAIVIHCSDSPKATTKTADIRRWHVQERGWSDIGYHRVIEGDGSVHQGRPDDVAGAHAEGYNSGSLGICVTGAFDRESISLDDAQGEALVQVVATLAKRHGVAPKDIIGHRDVYPRIKQPVAKSCPGARLYALLPELRRRVAAYLDADKGARRG